ncbi:Opacity protein [Mariprofundus aestuarium]|uniref:Opacity protein n=1 Tax=Mariprofundus aestuarium TaxID=1921086 RepID=A0A2K8KX42_MARES|nr:outer membrane beta-barrel protein [Mariprofundus aestuarium]ATX79423.1 Opacity protein [Mariprofundus aestuarium]
MKKTVTSFIAALAAITSMASVAHASDPYVGVGVGSFILNDGISKKASTIGTYLQVGDNFSEFLGGEIRIGTSGSTKEELAIIAGNKIDYFAAAFLKPQIKIAEDFTGYALIGVGTIRATHSPVAGLSSSKIRSGLGYGLGFSYSAMDNLGISGEWSHLNSKPKGASSANYKGVSASMYTLSLQYHFY